MTPDFLGNVETHQGTAAVYEVPQLLIYRYATYEVPQPDHQHAYVAFIDNRAVAFVSVNVPVAPGPDPAVNITRNRDPLDWDETSKEVEDVYAVADARGTTPDGSDSVAVAWASSCSPGSSSRPSRVVDPPLATRGPAEFCPAGPKPRTSTC